MRERAPEIVDEVRVPRLADIIEHGACVGRKFVVGEQFYGGHGFSR
jgi:hypothetical protein